MSVLAVAVGASPGMTAGRLRASPARGSDGAFVVAQQRVGRHLVDLSMQLPALGRTAKVRLSPPTASSSGGPHAHDRAQLVVVAFQAGLAPRGGS
ncbi:MAG TPA: hypothetical protein VG276_26195 [Actinomycetes bacterium]|nr:hypothetical protein [Actinomycetes bacterium]